MRPTEFNVETIVNAGQALQAEGKNITGFALRKKIGGGDPARLKKVWEENGSQQSTAADEPIKDLPLEVTEMLDGMSRIITDQVTALASKMNCVAVKAAERRVNDIMREAGEQAKNAESELTDAIQTIDELEKKIDQMTSASEAAEKSLANHLAAQHEQAIELAQMRERLALSEKTANIESEQHANKINQMDARIENDRCQHQQEIDSLRTELAKALAKAEATEQTHSELRKTVAQETNRTAERMAKAKSEHNELRQEAGAAREAAAKLSGQVETLKNQVAEQLRIFATRQTENDETSSKVVKTGRTKKPDLS